MPVLRYIARTITAFLAIGALGFANAQSLPAASPAEVGLSAARVSLFAGELRRRVEAGELPGAVLMIVRDGRIAAREAIGFQDREKRIPMKPDSIFRIASMTKPIVSVAVMMLAEEG